jgi:ribosome biogenesis GTPase
MQTTRHSEIFISRRGDFVVDTPGFSSFTPDVAAGELWRYYPEFYEYSDCHFDSCLHLTEPGCNVKMAVGKGIIPVSRYDTYCSVYRELALSTSRRRQRDLP